LSENPIPADPLHKKFLAHRKANADEAALFLKKLHPSEPRKLQKSVVAALGLVLGALVAGTAHAALVMKQEVHLGLPTQDVAILCVTLAISVLTFGLGRTNLLQGAIHLLVFLFWLSLVLES
jgi:Ca2+:H+ antiporter